MKPSRFSVSIPADLRKQTREMARQMCLSESDVVRLALKNYAGSTDPAVNPSTKTVARGGNG